METLAAEITTDQNIQESFTMKLGIYRELTTSGEYYTLTPFVGPFLSVRRSIHTHFSVFSLSRYDGQEIPALTQRTPSVGD